MALLYNLSSSRRWRRCLTICHILRSNNNMKELLKSRSSDSWGLRLLMRRSALSESTPSASKTPYACLMVSQFDVILFFTCWKKEKSLAFHWNERLRAQRLKVRCTYKLEMSKYSSILEWCLKPFYLFIYLYYLALIQKTPKPPTSSVSRSLVSRKTLVPDLKTWPGNIPVQHFSLQSYLTVNWWALLNFIFSAGWKCRLKSSVLPTPFAQLYHKLFTGRK